MTPSLYVKRDTYPSVIPGDEVMVLSNVRGTDGAPPRFFVKALATNTTYQVRTGQGDLVDNFTNVIPGSGTLENGQGAQVDLSTAVSNDHCVYVLRCLTGRLAATIVSPHQVKMQFRSRGRSVV